MQWADWYEETRRTETEHETTSKKEKVKCYKVAGRCRALMCKHKLG
jgi:hypothetical protein